MTDDTDLAPRIQHTLIQPGIDSAQLIRHCQECIRYGFDAAMVPANWVRLARETLDGTGVKVASAVDFPLGMMTTSGKIAEAKAVVAAGAEQIDTGAKIGALRSGQLREFRDDLAELISAVNVPVKVMLELALLDQRQRDIAVDIAVEAGAAYVKNASSRAVSTANIAEIRYLKGRIPPGVKIKASGGIATHDHAQDLLEAGADLVGTSAAVDLVTRPAVKPSAAY